MLWETIKKILQKHGGTCIIIEEGKPSYVVTSFQTFQASLDVEGTLPSIKSVGNISEQGLLEKINQEINDWKTAQAEEQVVEQNTEEDIKIEDLPL